MGVLSEIEGYALCGPPFSQVAAERQRRRDAFLAALLQAVQASQADLHTTVRELQHISAGRCGALAC